LVLFLSLNGLVVASAQSLPGDALYPVKRAAEDVSLKLAPSAEVRRKMSEDYQQRRTDEIGSLMALNLVRNIALEGVVDETGDGRIVLDGIPVIISADTKLSGELKPGRLVKLEGVTRPGGWIEADNIQLRFYEYGGRLNATQRGTWTIDDKNFKILTSTHIDPALKVGDQVLVLVYSSDDGTQYAQAVLRIPESLSSQTAGFEPFEVEISGTVEGVSGDKLLVNGKNIKITDQTEIKGDVAIGSVIKVHALVAADGSLTASKIEPATQELIGSEEQKSDDDSSGDAEDSSSVSDSDEDNSSISNDDGSEDDKSGSETSDDSEDKNDSDSDDDHKGSDDDHEDSEDKGKEEDGKPDD
jgi:exosome complex RNA-binding protein Csl4